MARTYICCNCSVVMEESWPMLEKLDKHYCPECSFILGLISESQFMKSSRFLPSDWRAAIYEGKIYHQFPGKKFFWEKKPREQRNSVENRTWRNDVFLRDNFTCQKCSKRGGRLEAHHIKPFAKHPELRLVVDNGITYCKPCHRKEHGRNCNG